MITMTITAINPDHQQDVTEFMRLESVFMDWREKDAQGSTFTTRIEKAKAYERARYKWNTLPKDEQANIVKARPDIQHGYDIFQNGTED